MQKFRFTSTQTNGVKIHISFEAETLTEICEQFESFLLAAGFRLPEGVHIGYEYDTEQNDH